jgi:hypothetical protein
MVNRFIQYQHCPAKWLDVGIALIPKSDGAQGLGSGRPISLIEALMKLAEEWTSPRFKKAMLRHPSPGDLKLPAQPKGRMSRMQFFNSGGGRSCQHALVLLISTMQAMTVQRRRFVLVNTDVKGAFPSAPTDFMG